MVTQSGEHTNLNFRIRFAYAKSEIKKKPPYPSPPPEPKLRNNVKRKKNFFRAPFVLLGGNHHALVLWGDTIWRVKKTCAGKDISFGYKYDTCSNLPHTHMGSPGSLVLFKTLCFRE